MRAQMQGIAAIVFASLVWGTTGTAARFAPEVGPIAIGAAAMGIGGLLQALWARADIRRDWQILLGLWRFWLLGAVAVVVYPLAFYGSMALAGVTIGTVVSLGLAPVFAAVIEMWREGRRPTPRWAMSATLGILGVFLLSLAREPASAYAPAPTLGMVIGLVAGFCYALYSWTARQMMAKTTSRAAMGATFGLGGLLLMPILAVTGGAFLDSANNFAVGAYMALVPMTLGYLAFGAGLARVSATMATTITLLEPVVAALLALWLLQEQLSPLGWLGVAAVGMCLVLLSWPGREGSPRGESDNL